MSFKLFCLVLVAATLGAQDLATLARAYRKDPTPANHAAVLHYANGHKDASGGLAFLVLGSKELELRDHAEALHHLEIAAKRAPALLDYSAYLGASARFELKKFAEVERALKPVWDRTPASPLVSKGVILLANAYLKEAKPKQAAALVQAHFKDVKPPEAEILLAHAFEDDGDAAAAKLHFDRILTEYPASPEDADAESDPARLAGLPLKARLTRCLKLIDANNPGQARHELEALLPKLSGAQHDLASVKLGVAEYQARENPAAYEQLHGLQISAGEADAERLYYLVRIARRLDRAADFKPSLERLAGAYPHSAWRLQALLAAGDFYWFKHDPESYEPVYRSCAETFATDPQSSECQWRIAWAEYLQRSPSAHDRLLALLKQHGDSDKVSNAMYFLARLAEGRNEPAKARAYYDRIIANYPNFFYATLARERLTSGPLATTPPAPDTVAFLDSIGLTMRSYAGNFVASPLSRERTARARLLASAGLDDLAESELRFGAKTDGQPEVAVIALAELASQRDAPDLGIRYIKQLAPGYLRIPIESAPEIFWKLAYPFPFRDSLEHYAREHGLDPFLVAALIRQESEFNPAVISRAKAYGLTQVLPSTAREIGRKLSLHGFRADMLFTPDINLKIGTYFLRSLLDRLEGKMEATLASYNAGQSRVNKWLTWAEFREPAEFIETIPFDETRLYVQSVLRNADFYRRLYGTRTVALASSKGNIRGKDAGPSGRNRKSTAPVP